MCLETNYLNFGGAAKPEQFNFADMGIISPTNYQYNPAFVRTQNLCRVRPEHLDLVLR
jgi:hypothetical protein